VLCDLIYQTAVELRGPGGKERLLEMKVPAAYVALEELVQQLAQERRQQGLDPVLTAAQFRSAVQDTSGRRPFRDAAELNRATAFLHENGALQEFVHDLQIN